MKNNSMERTTFPGIRHDSNMNVIKTEDFDDENNDSFTYHEERLFESDQMLIDKETQDIVNMLKNNAKKPTYQQKQQT
jgi:hypothetical protein